MVAQVKFKREDEEDNADWMIQALEGEKPKIESLSKRGVERYLMVTNASGTAHLDKGRIDRAQAWLEDNSPIPAEVLWRDDLSRRLDGDNAIKLAYPGLLTGENALSIVYDAMFAPQKKHLAGVIRSFVAEQYRIDSNVKFRQVDLQNSLTALFVDVPANLEMLMAKVQRSGRADQKKIRIMYELISTGGLRGRYDDSLAFQVAGTADLLLSASLQSVAPNLVLQGAPGQGKSTLAQYVCQVHRARLLEKIEFLDGIDRSHKEAPFRLPMKVDLRDLAAYLDGQEYMRHPAEPIDSNRTLERFLASLVAIQGSSDSFTTDDLRLVLTDAPGLLFLDGLDEVADLPLRQRLLEKVGAGLGRLGDAGADLQVVITSRPAQLGQGMKLPEGFFRLNLAPLGPDTVQQYAGKWTRARSLDENRASEVISILTGKLGLEHIRELTKNPMQLTILLTLINRFGQSLPDERTGLYREYVSLFMMREAEKDEVVARHKGLLLDVVEYLAWELQSSAEANASAGSISEADLRRLVAEFIDRTGRDRSILAELFEQGLERIYVLVTRIEGLYEFEVQPLREYFAARYLYSTAPSPTFRTQVVHGDRLQRFEAIAANPYWANVTRFYAGFWEQGEVVALSASLRELISNADMESGINARAVGTALLADRAFAARPFVQDEVVDAIFDPIGVHLAALTRLNGYELIALARECGRDRLAKIIFHDHLTEDHQPGYGAICSLLWRNGGAALSDDFRAWIVEAKGSERTRRMAIAAASNGLSKLSLEAIGDIIDGDGESDAFNLYRRRSYALENPSDSVLTAPGVVEQAFQEMLDWGGYPVPLPRTDVQAVASLLASPYSWAHNDYSELKPVLPAPHGAVVASVLDRLQRERHTVMDIGELVGVTADVLLESFGDRWGVLRFALEFEGMLDAKRPRAGGALDDLPIMGQISRARQWRGRPSWWAERIQGQDGPRRLFWLAVLLGWGPSSQVAAALGTVETEVAALGREDAERLEEVLKAIYQGRRARAGRRRSPVPLPLAASDLLARLLVVAFGVDGVVGLPARAAENEALGEFISGSRVAADLEKFTSWSDVAPRAHNRWLALLQKAHDLRVTVSADTHRALLDRNSMPPRCASRIVADATRYDHEYVSAAVGALQIAHVPDSVRAIAKRESWTF
ncbi:NACHT domain-containing NTPase [Curtobacterium sp. MWU13-2055]|uniref:NACHT domain-containing protein n=1 Tax=Curtobacterium sp. MWU13-2055 TaxID=2931928 RepID=UPI00200F1F4B|nr:hypothetical protein [Curtobacterium sp. MWU13-2055]